MRKIYIALFASCITQSVTAEFVCNDTDYVAVYQINQYTCNVGEYLPANTDQCVTCPKAGVCDGGIFEFNNSEFQGLRINNISTTEINNVCAHNFPSELSAIYVPNQHLCATGYYLPANTDGCVACPSGYTCAGGTYTFNETIDQGKVGNTITINWVETDSADIITNNAASMVYGGDIRTPASVHTLPGRRFIGWRFTPANQ